MKTFKDFTTGKPEAVSTAGFPTFNEAMKEGKSCMSESMMEMLKECSESMMAEMKACHEDETENTAESYMKECEGKINEMYEAMKAHCNECMK